MYNWLKYESDDNPRNLAAGVVGVLSGLGGTDVALVGLVVGAIGQYAYERDSSLRPYQHYIDGLLDGSAAIVTMKLFRP